LGISQNAHVQLEKIPTPFDTSEKKFALRHRKRIRKLGKMEILANTLIRPGLRLQQLTLEDLLLTSTIYFPIFEFKAHYYFLRNDSSIEKKSY